MNYLKLMFVVVGLLLYSGLSAQETDYGKNFFGTKLLFIDLGTPNNFDGQLTNGLELSYRRNINSYLSASIPLKAGFMDVPDDQNNHLFFSIDAIIRGQYYKPMAKVVPYVFAGYGYVAESDGPSNAQIPVGLGADIRVGNNSYFNFQIEYRVSDELQRDNLQLGLGLAFRLGKMKKPDSDGDGISDANDDCPDLAGLPSMRGCPDRDGDGVSDLADICPDEAGTEASKGCPDKDGDGIPDRDDACPDIAGLADREGCPEEQETSQDQDGDGVPDNLDECPDQIGSLNGCPDSDEDGVADSRDKCPEEIGTLENDGCPEETSQNEDSDADGFTNEVDLCPDEPGTLDGCPDRDEDGVADKDDQCPEEFGVASLQGCPEKEERMSLSNENKEAAKEESASATISDRDGDGFSDEEDDCPDQAGNVNGCPEESLEAPVEKVTKVRGETGFAAGTKDSDGDGIADNIDVCPEEAGTLENKGCPGMSTEDKKVLEIATQTVRFETGNSILVDDSYQVLDQVALIMQRYSKHHLEISGHTDGSGSMNTNLILSEDRAQACYAYLVGKGILPQRMSFKGYGESRPVGDNNRSSGRKRNRRVEFKMFVPK